MPANYLTTEEHHANNFARNARYLRDAGQLLRDARKSLIAIYAGDDSACLPPERIVTDACELFLLSQAVVLNAMDIARLADSIAASELIEQMRADCGVDFSAAEVAAHRACVDALRSSRLVPR